MKGFFTAWPFQWLPMAALQGRCVKALLLLLESNTPGHEAVPQARSCLWELASEPLCSHILLDFLVALIIRGERKKINKNITFSVSRTGSELPLLFFFCVSAASGAQGWLQSTKDWGERRNFFFLTEKRGVFDRADVFQGGSSVTSVRVCIQLVNSRR